MSDIHPQRTSILIPLAAPAAIDTQAAIGLFHRVIQQRGLEGLLLDVADYAHVPRGPDVLLVGHDVDYGVSDEGLLVVRKRQRDTPLPEQLRDALRMALEAVRFIVADGALGVGFDTTRLQISVLDRAALANSDEGAAVLEAAVRATLGEVLGSPLEIARANASDSRSNVAISVRAPALDMEKALATLGSGGAVTGTSAAQCEWDISVEDLRKLRDEGADHVLIDVREPSEYEHVNLSGVLIPLGELPKRMGEIAKEAHVVVHCKVGGRGAKATQMLRDAGFENAWHVNGGIVAWVERIDPSLPKP